MSGKIKYKKKKKRKDPPEENTPSYKPHRRKDRKRGCNKKSIDSLATMHTAAKVNFLRQVSNRVIYTIFFHFFFSQI